MKSTNSFLVISSPTVFNICLTFSSSKSKLNILSDDKSSFLIALLSFDLDDSISCFNVFIPSNISLDIIIFLLLAALSTTVLSLS